MRLFTGIALPQEVTDNLEALVGDLRPAARIKWSPVRNLHITTKFIGEWPDDRLDELAAALGEVPSPGPIPIAIRTLGWFPNERSPRVFWAGIEAPDALHELARATDAKAAELGVAPETRRYSPHLTLARIKGPADLRELRRRVDGLPSHEFGRFEANCFHLFQSKLQPGGSVYTRLREYDL